LAKGFPVSYAFANRSRDRARWCGSGIEAHFPENGAFFDVGETLAQPELAATLERIAKNGANEFYEGETAKRFAAEMAKHGGIITEADLKNYKAIERTPLRGKYKNYTVITAPPSSSGGIALLEMLGIIEGTKYEDGGSGSASAIHYVAEAMRLAYADRNEYVGDPAFVKVPIAGCSTRRITPGCAPRSIRRRRRRAAWSSRASLRQREHGDDSLFGRRQRRQRGRGHLHVERCVRQRHHGARTWLSPEQRDG
jgi:gamma-glutamyltranspeptidase/glutathione hydrolase